jgi:hypothetical protein
LPIALRGSSSTISTAATRCILSRHALAKAQIASGSASPRTTTKATGGSHRPREGDAHCLRIVRVRADAVRVGDRPGLDRATVAWIADGVAEDSRAATAAHRACG